MLDLRDWTVFDVLVWLIFLAVALVLGTAGYLAYADFHPDIETKTIPITSSAEIAQVGGYQIVVMKVEGPTHGNGIPGPCKFIAFRLKNHDGFQVLHDPQCPVCYPNKAEMEKTR